MDAAKTIMLGTDPERQTEMMRQIIVLGFPEGTIAICWQCNKVLTFTVDEAAKHTTQGTWPRCCNERMDMAAPGEEPPF